jgi:hypothetical protein
MYENWNVIEEARVDFHSYYYCDDDRCEKPVEVVKQDRKNCAWI